MEEEALLARPGENNWTQNQAMHWSTIRMVGEVASAAHRASTSRRAG